MLHLEEGAAVVGSAAEGSAQASSELPETSAVEDPDDRDTRRDQHAGDLSKGFRRVFDELQAIHAESHLELLTAKRQRLHGPSNGEERSSSTPGSSFGAASHFKGAIGPNHS